MTFVFPKIWAHRGARSQAPENTLAAFRRAFELGADGVELDVMCCGTGELVVFHDYEVSRLTTGKGKTGELSLQVLKSLDVGSHFSPQFAGEPPPTLPEVLDALPPTASINIEIKNEAIRSAGEEQIVVKLIRQYHLLDRAIVSSFNPFVLRRVRKLDPHIRIGYLHEAHPRLYLRPKAVSTWLRPNAVHPEFTVVTSEMIRRAHQRGVAVHAWTVNEVEVMRRLIEWGVDALITDFPERALKLKAEYLTGSE